MKVTTVGATLVALIVGGASVFAGAEPLVIGGKAARDVFHDERVVSLLDAALGGNEQKAKQLNSAGANVNAMGEAGVTPLLWAMSKQNVQAVKILLDLGADPNEYKPGEVGVEGIPPPVWSAADGRQLDVLQLLLDHGGNPNTVNGTHSALVAAVSDRRFECADLLLKHGADINYSSGPVNALFEAVGRAQFDDVIWILSHGYMHDLQMARRMIVDTTPRVGQEKIEGRGIEACRPIAC